LSKILLVEPSGNYIRLDRCMQSINSWGGVYRFPLNLARIGAHLLALGHSVQFIDLQADKNANLKNKLIEFNPDYCILSSGFPSMEIDSNTAKEIKSILPSTHLSTFGVAPTLLKDSFFSQSTWGFEIHFDSIVVGGEPAFGYESLINDNVIGKKILIESSMQKVKSIKTLLARPLFNHSFYKSPFSGENATYIEGSYGCPHSCSFCVVPVLYDSRFSKRTVQDIVDEFKYVLENDNVKQITLWDEGTTFQKSFIKDLCKSLIELRKSSDPKLQNFNWTTRSTTTLLDEEVVQLMAESGLSGITLGIESFDEEILGTIEKGISISSNNTAIQLLSKYGIISIGHIILGHLNDTKESIEKTIKGAIESNLNFAQFYCAVPYPGTKLHKMALNHNLIAVTDLTKFELSNPIMDTLGGLSYTEVGNYRNLATDLFWSKERWNKLNNLILNNKGISIEQQKLFMNWNTKAPATQHVDVLNEEFV
jgi:anaerobic magnesium-protoporphyrin IX monomethyl ester cyclase